MNQSLQKNPFPASESAAVKPKAEAGPDLVTQMTDDEKINLAAARILTEYRSAFEELAK